MSDRDDDGYNSPEGKEVSEEAQRRKAALAKLTVDGGAAEENSDEMSATVEKEKKAEDFREFMAKELTDLNEEGLWILHRFGSLKKKHLFWI